MPQTRGCLYHCNTGIFSFAIPFPDHAGLSIFPLTLFFWLPYRILEPGKSLAKASHFTELISMNVNAFFEYSNFFYYLQSLT